MDFRGGKCALGAVLLAFLLTGCDQKKTETWVTSPPPAPPKPTPPSPPPPTPTPPTAKTYSQVMLERQMQWLEKSRGYFQERAMGGGHTSHWCAEGLDCRPYVVLVHIDGVGMCTGVLVTPSIVLTNRHCVERVGSEPYAPLSTSIIVERPQKSKGNNEGFGKDTAFVKQLIGISPKEFNVDGMVTDYAFLSLTTPMEGAMGAKLNFDGLNDGETYFVYGVSPYGDAKDKDAIERRECKAVYKTTNAPLFDSPKMPVVQLADCPIGPSNSGAPIYNRRGELVGLIAGQFAPRLVQALNQLGALFLRNIDPSALLTDVGWGTNLACMPDMRDLTKPISAECDPHFSRPFTLLEIPAPAVDLVSADLKSLPLRDDKFRYVVERANEADQTLRAITQSVYARIPECVEKAELTQLSSPLEMEISISALMLTPDWQIAPSKVSGIRRQKFSLKFDVDQLKSKGATKMEVYIVGDARLHTRTLRVCK